MLRVFDTIANAYDQWYDTPKGRAIFRAELACLGSLHDTGYEGWLEVGVGTGCFAHSLGISSGIDPSPQMLAMAAGRGINTCEGCAEYLPFPAASFNGILLALTLCFIEAPEQALKECRRVLRPAGRLLVGIVPVDSPWGRAYSARAERKHTVYSAGQFRTAAHMEALARDAGFQLVHAQSTLFWKPGQAPEARPRIETGIIPEAGFLGLLFRPVPGRPGADTA